MKKDFVQLPAKQVMLTMLGVMLAMFMAALGQTVVATAMPVIIADLGGFERYTWAATAYLVAATVSIPIVGRLTDLYGRKVFLISTMNANTSSSAAVGYVVIMSLGLGGVLATFNLAVQNVVPFRLVGTATSALLFYRLIGGTLGLAVLGVVMTHRFSSRVEEAVSDTVRAALGPSRLDAIKDNPRALIDPAALDALRAEFAETQLADALLGTLRSALAEAVGDVFAISVVAIALSVVLSLFLGSVFV